ncbi:hypothetical protein DBV15_12111, partial [Temnothorax longispinosus]
WRCRRPVGDIRPAPLYASLPLSVVSGARFASYRGVDWLLGVTWYTRFESLFLEKTSGFLLPGALVVTSNLPTAFASAYHAPFAISAGIGSRELALCGSRPTGLPEADHALGYRVGYPVRYFAGHLSAVDGNGCARFALASRSHWEHLSSQKMLSLLLRGASFCGAPGIPAANGIGPRNRGFYFARHSQTEMIPICPRNTVKIWEGFSLLHTMGNGRPYAQDLGAAGSCIKKFSTMLFLFCNLNNVCDYPNRNDYSYWLSTTEPMPMMMTPISAPEVGRYISRCSVCEAPTRVIAVDSQFMAIPECSGGWEEIWVGYSFLMDDDHDEDGSEWFDLKLTRVEWEEIKPDNTCERTRKALKPRVWGNVIAKAFWRRYNFPSRDR